MKLAPLPSGARKQAYSSLASLSHMVENKVHRVEALDSSSPDRKRSLQDEMAEIEPNAIGLFHGNERILQNARELAAELSALSGHISTLVKPGNHLAQIHRIDDEV